MKGAYFLNSFVTGLMMTSFTFVLACEPEIVWGQSPSKLQGVVDQLNNAPLRAVDGAQSQRGAALGAGNPSAQAAKSLQQEVSQATNLKNESTGEWGPSDSDVVVKPPQIVGVPPGDGGAGQTGAALIGLHNLPEVSQPDPSYPASPGGGLGDLIPSFEGDRLPPSIFGVLGAGFMNGLSPEMLIQLGISSGVIQLPIGKSAAALPGSQPPSK